MAFYIHAIYAMHNTYWHISSRSELKLSVERIVLDMPLRPSLAAYVREVVRGVGVALSSVPDM